MLRNKNVRFKEYIAKSLVLFTIAFLILTIGLFSMGVMFLAQWAAILTAVPILLLILLFFWD